MAAKISHHHTGTLLYNVLDFGLRCFRQQNSSFQCTDNGGSTSSYHGRKFEISHLPGLDLELYQFLPNILHLLFNRLTV